LFSFTGHWKVTKIFTAQRNLTRPKNNTNIAQALSVVLALLIAANINRDVELSFGHDAKTTDYFQYHPKFNENPSTTFQEILLTE